MSIRCSENLILVLVELITADRLLPPLLGASRASIQPLLSILDHLVNHIHLVDHLMDHTT
jgi:hypothetical protein